MAETHALSSKILLFSRDDLYSTDSRKKKTMNIKTVSSYTVHTVKGEVLLPQSN